MLRNYGISWVSSLIGFVYTPGCFLAGSCFTGGWGGWGVGGWGEGRGGEGGGESP